MNRKQGNREQETCPQAAPRNKEQYAGRLRRTNRSARRGFTLLEVMVALVIFGILTIALSNAMAAAMKARLLAEQRQDDSATVRAIFGIMGRDLQSAYGSVYDPNSLFVTGGGGSGSSSTAAVGSLLTMAAIVHRISTTDPNVDPSTDPATATLGSVNSAQNGSNDPPQSPVALIRYDYDPQSGVLSRVAQPIPYLQTLQQATPSPDNVLASNVISLQLQYWDPTQLNWRDSWDFEQPNLPPSATAATTLSLPIASDTTTTATGPGAPTASVPTSGTSGTSSGAGAAASSSSNSSASTGNSDLSLPSAIQITLTIRKRDGTPGTYTTILPIVTPTLQNYPYVGGQTVNPVTAAAANGQTTQ